MVCETSTDSQSLECAILDFVAARDEVKASFSMGTSDPVRWTALSKEKRAATTLLDLIERHADSLIGESIRQRAAA